MGKNSAGGSAYIESVAVEGDEVIITAVAGVAGAIRATRVADIFVGVDVEELVAAEIEEAMVLVEMVAAGVAKGTAAMDAAADDDEELREGPVVGSSVNVGGLIAQVKEGGFVATCHRGYRGQVPFLKISFPNLEGVYRARDALRNTPDGWPFETHTSSDDSVRAIELRAERAERRVAILERAGHSEFEWEGSVDVGTFNSPAKVRIRTTQEGFEAIEAALAHVDPVWEAMLSGAQRSADEHEKLWQDEVARAAALEQRVRDLEGTVDTYARFARAMRHLNVVGAAA